MEAQIKKLGNSASIRIPIAILDTVDFSIGQKVEIRAEGGRIIIEPIRKPFTLESLLNGITPENLHGEVQGF